MNERIKELSLQAADEIADLFSPGFFDDRMINDVAEINKKFAELIVRECMRMCDVADMSLLEHNCVKEASGTQSAKDFIKEHFGVEE